MYFIVRLFQVIKSVPPMLVAMFSVLPLADLICITFTFISMSSICGQKIHCTHDSCVFLPYFNFPILCNPICFHGHTTYIFLISFWSLIKKGVIIAQCPHPYFLASILCCWTSFVLYDSTYTSTIWPSSKTFCVELCTRREFDEIGCDSGIVIHAMEHAFTFQGLWFLCRQGKEELKVCQSYEP